jgi:isopenicillin N synthase-like dioxygenase
MRFADSPDPQIQSSSPDVLGLQVRTTGFFSVTGTGFTDEEVTRQYSIGQAYFNRPVEEKAKPELRCDFGKGNYFGYRAVCRPSAGEMAAADTHREGQ